MNGAVTQVSQTSAEATLQLPSTSPGLNDQNYSIIWCKRHAVIGVDGCQQMKGFCSESRCLGFF